jgi:hypothetical protein
LFILSKKDSLMEFRIADTITGSLARLTGDERKAVKTTVVRWTTCWTRKND